MNSDPLITYRRKPANFDTAALEAFAATLQKRVAKGRGLHRVITGDAELRSLNHRWLGKDYPTDVLSFPSGVADPIGEIVISIMRAREQAKEFGHSAEDEVRTLMLHGTLHLMGMDHDADSGEMARAEGRWRRKLGLPTGLIERVTKRVSNNHRATRQKA